jgi:hypothetical protein
VIHDRAVPGEPTGSPGRVLGRYGAPSMPDDDDLRLPPGARTVLTAPAAVTRALAGAAPEPDQRWMLRLPRDVRRSFVADVLDRGGRRADQERWLLLHDDEVRHSYVEEVLLAQPDPDPQEIWMLRQPRAVRESYVREVLDAGREAR